MRDKPLTAQERMGLVIRSSALARAALDMQTATDQSILRLHLKAVAKLFVDLDCATEAGTLGQAEP